MNESLAEPFSFGHRAAFGIEKLKFCIIKSDTNTMGSERFWYEVSKV